MIGLKDKLRADLTTGLKAGDKMRVSTLRFLLSHLHNLEIQKQKELSEEEILGAIQKQARDHEESIALFKKGGRPDLAAKEKEELEILKSYLPAELSQEELEALVREAIEEGNFASPADFGKVMAALMPKVKGRARGETIAGLVRAKLAAV